MNFIELFLVGLLLAICQHVVVSLKEETITSLVSKEKDRIDKLLKVNGKVRQARHLDINVIGGWLDKIITDVTHNRKPNGTFNRQPFNAINSNHSSTIRPGFQNIGSSSRPDSGIDLPSNRPEFDNSPINRPDYENNRPNDRPEFVINRPFNRPDFGNNRPNEPFTSNRPNDYKPIHENSPFEERPGFGNNRPNELFSGNRPYDYKPIHENRPFEERPYDNRPSDTNETPNHGRPHLPLPSQPHELMENGNTLELNDYRLTEGDKVKLSELESKWASLRKQGIVAENDDDSDELASRTRNRFANKKKGYRRYYKEYFDVSTPHEPLSPQYYGQPSTHYPKTPHFRPPNRRPYKPPVLDYVYNLYFKTMTLGERCLTPNMEAGFCRLVEDCPIKPIITDYANFLKYSCTIGKHGVGVCCPANYRGEEKPRPSTRPPTTRPATARPTARPNTTKPTPRPTSKPHSGGGGGGRRSLIEEAKGDCGYTPKTRIVGGKDAKKDAWPWAVPIFNAASYKDQFCGAALISRRHVLTAAHCMVSRKPKDIFVRVGAYNIQEEDENLDAYNVVKIVSHPQYNNVSNANDISILTLEKDVKFDAKSNPVCIPEDGDDYVKQNATVIGWGTTSYSGTSSVTLKEVTVPVWAIKECQNVYGKEKITDKQICAGLKQGGKDSCQGDSGGPLLRLSTTRRRFEVIGVVSYGFRCAEANNPGVYTKVNRYQKWIEEQTAL